MALSQAYNFATSCSLPAGGDTGAQKGMDVLSRHLALAGTQCEIVKTFVSTHACDAGFLSLTAEDWSMVQGFGCYCMASHADFPASHVIFLGHMIICWHCMFGAARTCCSQGSRPRRDAQAASVWHMGVSSGIGQYRGSAAVAISATSPSPYTRGYLFCVSAASAPGNPATSLKTPSNGQNRQQHLLAPKQDTH